MTLKREFDLLRDDIAAFERRLMVKLGVITAAAVCLAVTLAKLQ